MSNIHNLETEELKTLLNEASKADPATQETSTPETASLDQTTTASPEVTTASHEATTSPPQATQTADTQDLGESQQIQSDSPQTTTTPIEEPKQQQQIEPTFSQKQFKELREFARMYKMYQFIKKMEKRVNDPDCAPVCRTLCKSFCPAKCCRVHHNTTNLPNGLSQTVNNFSAKVNHPHPTKPPAARKLDASLVEDDKQEDEDEKEEREMNEMAGKKHLFVKIVKNNELDKPRNQIQQKN